MNEEVKIQNEQIKLAHRVLFVSSFFILHSAFSR
jgi:hypothetical protein